MNIRQKGLFWQAFLLFSYIASGFGFGRKNLAFSTKITALLWQIAKSRIEYTKHKSPRRFRVNFKNKNKETAACRRIFVKEGFLCQALTIVKKP